MKKQSIIINTSQSNINNKIRVIQEDSARILSCILSDYSIPEDSAGRIYAVKPSEAVVYQDGTIINSNTIEFELTNQLIAEIGETKVQVEITESNGSVLTSFEFVIEVKKRLKDASAIESTNEFAALEKALGKVQNIDAKISSLKTADNVLSSRIDTLTSLKEGSTTGDAELLDIRVKADGTTATSAGNAIREQVSELKEDLGDVSSSITSLLNSAGFDVLSVDLVEGTIDSRTGLVGKSTNNAITDFIESTSLGKYIYITPQKERGVFAYRYDSDRNFIGIAINNSTTEKILIPDCAYYRFMIKNADGSKINIASANLSAIIGIKSGVISKELSALTSRTIPSFLLNQNKKINAATAFLMTKKYQIDGGTGLEFKSTRDIMISDFIPVRDAENKLLVESVECKFNDPSPSGNAVMFFYDSHKEYLTQQVIARENAEEMTVLMSNYANANYIRLQYHLDMLPNMEIFLNVTQKIYEWIRIKKQQIYDDAIIDTGVNYYLIKGEPLELFRHGMIRKKYGNYSKPEGDYLISLNNNPGYSSDYVSKLVFNVPDTVTGNKLGIYEPFTSAPAFRLYDLNMKSLSYQYINIYMANKKEISNSNRNICFFGDSLTAMGYISKHVKDKLHEYGLTNTKLVGVNTNLDDEENRFTATGGYSWDNYTKNPSLLPVKLGDNHLWNPNVNDIDFSYFMGKYGNGETINYAIVLIGWNDYDMRNTTWKDYATEGISAIERKARKFIGRLHEQYPNCKILLVGYHVSTTAERNMHPNLPYEARNKFVWELNDLYKSLEHEFSFVYFIHTASQFDSYNNMRKKETKPNIYATNTVEMITDDVHPAPEGYYQYGDAELRCLMYLMQNE